MSGKCLVVVAQWAKTTAGRQIHPTARLLAFAVADHMNLKGEAWMHQATLAAELGLSRRQTIYQLARLDGAVFDVKRRGRGLSNVYTLRSEAGRTSRSEADRTSKAAPEVKPTAPQKCSGPHSRSEAGRTSLNNNLIKEPDQGTKKRAPRKFPPEAAELVRWAVKTWENAKEQEQVWSKAEFAVLTGVAARLGKKKFRGAWLHFLTDESDFYRGHSPKLFTFNVGRWTAAAGNGRRRPSKAAGTQYRVDEKVSV